MCSIMFKNRTALLRDRSSGCPVYFLALGTGPTNPAHRAPAFLFVPAPLVSRRPMRTFPSETEKRGRWPGRAVLWGELALVAAFLIYRFFVWYTAKPVVPGAVGVPDKVTLTAALRRGDFKVVEFPSQKVRTRALILFGSGDFGWGGWEDAVARSMADAGFEVIGIDCAAYAKTDYDLDTLQSDFTGWPRWRRRRWEIIRRP